MSASEIFCFLQISLSLISDKVAETDKYWKLGVSLRYIVEMVYAKKKWEINNSTLKCVLSTLAKLSKKNVI